MARQRFIWPDLWTDPKLGQLPPTILLFFVGCFSNADDEGRLLGSPAYLRSTIFPYQNFSLKRIQQIRDQAVANCENLDLYDADGVEYLALKKWGDYQKPKYPKPSKLPAPPWGKHGGSKKKPSGKVGGKKKEASVSGLGSGLGKSKDLALSGSRSEANGQGFEIPELRSVAP